jgi:hypothetical protein
MIRCEKGHGYSDVIHDECPACLRGEPEFNGSDYDSKHDHARLTGQIRRVKDLMADGAWRTLDEIAAKTGDPQASISAQLRNLRKERFGSHVIGKQARGERSHGLFEYRLEA